MSQMLYAGQSAREIVTFLSDFQQLYRAQFMYQVHEILIHKSQPICNPCGQILWSWVVLGLIYGRSNFCQKFYSMIWAWLIYSIWLICRVIYRESCPAKFPSSQQGILLGKTISLLRPRIDIFLYLHSFIFAAQLLHEYK